MAESDVPAWPRPIFKAGEQLTSIFFVVFGKAPLAEVPLSRSRFELPRGDFAERVDLREHLRSAKPEWFAGWWSASFGVIAAQDLKEDLSLLTTSDTCFTLQLQLPDRPDLAPLQAVWGLTRWLCARGADVVLDVHAFRYRSRQEVEEMSFREPDVLRDVKLVLETDPNSEGLHLLHTRGLCKFARPELLAWIHPDDGVLLGRAMSQIARSMMEGEIASQIHFRVAHGVELVSAPAGDPALIESLGLASAVSLVRADGAPLIGVGRHTGG